MQLWGSRWSILFWRENNSRSLNCWVDVQKAGIFGCLWSFHLNLGVDQKNSMSLDGKSPKLIARLSKVTNRSSPSGQTDLTEILQGFSVLFFNFFLNQRKALSLITEGKKTKTKGLKIVYFSTSIRRSSQRNTLEDYFFLFSDCSQSYVGLFLAEKLDLLLPPLTLSLNSNTIWQQQTVQNKSKIIQQHTQLRTFKTSWQMFGVTPDSHSCLP